MNLFRRQTKPAQPGPARPSPAARVRPAADPTQLHPAQMRVTDWQAEEADSDRSGRRRPQLPAAPTSYIPAGRSTIDVPVIHVASPDTHITAEITPAAHVESKTLGGHQDRARAWLKYSLPLCSTIALGMVIAAVTLYGMPLISLTALLTFCIAFVISYSVLLLQYWRHTPEGVALEHTNHEWRYLRSEQKHRHGIERESWQDQRQLTHRENRR